MGSRLDSMIAQMGGGINVTGAGTQYLVQTPSGVLYCVYGDSGSDIAFVKSTDGGLSWGAPTVIFVGTATAVAVWYDRWSNISAGLIHVAYTESATDDTLYRTINTESSDALSTQTVIFAGASTATGGMLSITRAVGGNVYCRTTIDAGAEGGFFRLLNADVPNGAWASRTINEANATQDQIILLPDFNAADTQDIYAIFWDASANEISRQKYDDSADTWSETSIAASMTDFAASSGAFPNFAVATDIANSRHILVAWSNVDVANSDLRCWTVDSTTITEKTNVVLDSTDDQGLCAICNDPINGVWWVFYAGKSDGSETWPTALNIYCKASTDGGTTWGPETQMTDAVRDIDMIATIPLLLAASPTPPPIFYAWDLAIDMLNCNAQNVKPRANFQLGL